MNKRLIFFFILVFPLIVTHQLCAQPAYNYVRSYEVKTGLVEYHNWWTGEAGSIIKFWWDDYGQKYREEFITKEEIKSINLANGSYFYTLNMQTLKGSKVEADVAAQIQEYYASQHSTYERGRETILGFECQATETADIITLSYKGVTLRESDASFGGDWLEAYFFDANAIIDPNLFQLPENIQIDDITQDLNSELMPHAEEDYYIEPLPVAVSYAQFVESATYLCRKLNYKDIVTHASTDTYFFGCHNYSEDFVEGISIQIQVLSYYSSIPNWTFAKGRELFHHKGRRLAYEIVENYDEEMGTKFNTSNLMVEMVDDNSILEIDAIPEKSKDEMIAIFEALDL